MKLAETEKKNKKRESLKHESRSAEFALIIIAVGVIVSVSFLSYTWVAICYEALVGK